MPQTPGAAVDADQDIALLESKEISRWNVEDLQGGESTNKIYATPRRQPSVLQQVNLLIFVRDFSQANL